MIEKAREALGDRADYLVADLSELEVPSPVDVIFLHCDLSLGPGPRPALLSPARRAQAGRPLIAQCGGEGNVAKHAQAIVERRHPAGVRRALRGHDDHVELRLTGRDRGAPAQRRFRSGPLLAREQASAARASYDFTTTVTMGPHLSRLPEGIRRSFAEAVLELEDDPLTLNYVRLNIEATSAG
jgi:hypothetical protein